jgi:diketogulonate reductase-like aldo/keto reductase
MDAMNKHLLNRRQFGARCAALSLAVPASSAMIAGQASAQVPVAGAASTPEPRTVKFPNGTIVPAVGQGSWHLASGRHPASVEEKAMRTGIDLGMTLIDTSDNYADGRSERLIGRVIKGQRDRVFVVSKVQEEAVFKNEIAARCADSLRRLGTDYLDLYLMHTPPKPQFLSKYLQTAVTSFERLRAAGKIRAWGVSNCGVEHMEALMRVPGGDQCQTNEVSYSLIHRGNELEVLPWCAQHNMPVIAYSPLGGIDNNLVGDPRLVPIAAMHGVSTSAVALGWNIRGGNVIAIPESGDPAHVNENAVALSIRWIPATL